MPDDLYTRDFFTWSSDQAAKLRRLSRGESVNDVDWPNVLTEVADLGLSEMRATRALLAKAIEHLLKVVAFPEAPELGHWMGEARTFLRDARFAWSPGMDRVLDLPEIYEIARKTVADLDYREGIGLPLPAECPVTLRDLIPKERMAVAQLRELIAAFRAAQ